METLKQMYLRNDVLLLFLWKQNGVINQRRIWQPQNAASSLLSLNESELKILIENANLFTEKLNLSEFENLKVYRVGSIQELLPDVEFIPC